VPIQTAFPEGFAGDGFAAADQSTTMI